MVIFDDLSVHPHQHHHYLNQHHPHFPREILLEINKFCFFIYITLSEHKSLAFSNTDLALDVRSRK